MANILIQPKSGILDFNTGIAGTNFAISSDQSGALRFVYNDEGGIKLSSYSTNKNRFSIEGSQGQIFSVTDDISGSLFRVNDINGLPYFETFSNQAAVLGEYNTNTFVISGRSVGIGTLPNTGSYKLNVSGNANIEGQLRTSGFLVAKNDDLLSTGILLVTNLASTGLSLKSDLQSSGQTLQTNITNLKNSSDTFLRLDSTTQSVLGNKIFLGNVTIQNLTVTGTQNVSSSNDLAVGSNFIVINSGQQGSNGISLITGGIRIDRGTGAAFPDALLIFNEANKRFEFGVVGAISGIAPIERLNDTITNIGSTGISLIDRDNRMSGSFNTTGLNLLNSINSLSGSLNSTGLNLFNTITSLSGSLNQSGLNLFIQSFNVQANLDVSGLNLKKDIISLSGSSLLLYGNQDVTGVKNFTSVPTVNGASIVTSLNIAEQSNIVYQIGNQIISGIKTFASPLTAPNIVFNTGNQNISGVKTFFSQPTLNGAPLLVSGTYGSIDIEAARVNINNGVIEQDISFIKNYSSNSTPVVVSNLYYTGHSDEIIAHQIQRVTHTGFRISLSRPVTGYSVNYWAIENTGSSFLALGQNSTIFSQKNNINTGVISQFITFNNTSLSKAPIVNLALEDRNIPPTENFFLFKATGINSTGFFLCLSERIPNSNTGYFLHTQVMP
jgi:hypothetical protein